MLTFAHTLGEFGVVLMVGGNLPGVTRTVSIAIYDDVQAFEFRGGASDRARCCSLFSFASLSRGLRAAAEAVGGRAARMNAVRRRRGRASRRTFSLDVAFDAAPGVTIVFGESGSGKTTVLRCRGRPGASGRGTDRDRRSRALRLAQTGVDVAPARRRVGFVFQHLALFPHLTAADNIDYGLHASVLPTSVASESTAIADSFRIAHLLDAQARRRFPAASASASALARSLVTDPELLLLDEPLSALDHATQSRIIADLRLWNEARRIPILYVTHSQREVFALGERVLVLEDGRIVADGTPEQVMEYPAHERVAQLAGFENLLDATVVQRRPDAGVMASRLAGTTVDLETPLADVEVGQPLRVAIRAGDILIATEPPRGLSARNQVPGTIDTLSRQGRSFESMSISACPSKCT